MSVGNRFSHGLTKTRPTSPLKATAPTAIAVDCSELLLLLRPDRPRAGQSHPVSPTTSFESFVWPAATWDHRAVKASEGSPRANWRTAECRLAARHIARNHKLI